MCCPYLSRQHWSVSGAGLAVFAVGFLICRAFGSPLVDRYGGPRVTMAIVAVSAIGFAALSLIHTAAGALAGAATVGIGVSLTFPATVATTLARTGQVSAGTSVGATTSFWDLGIMIAGPVSGITAAEASYTAAFAVGAVMALTCVAVNARMTQTMTIPQHKPASRNLSPRDHVRPPRDPNRHSESPAKERRRAGD